MYLSRRASYVTMVVGALVAWADIDTERVDATQFGLLVLAAGALVASIAHVLSWRIAREQVESGDARSPRSSDVTPVADGA